MFQGKSGGGAGKSHGGGGGGGHMSSKPYVSAIPSDPGVVLYRGELKKRINNNMNSISHGPPPSPPKSAGKPNVEVYKLIIKDQHSGGGTGGGGGGHSQQSIKTYKIIDQRSSSSSSAASHHGSSAHHGSHGQMQVFKVIHLNDNSQSNSGWSGY